MNNGNGGPGNIAAQGFENISAEAPDFNPNVLPTPDKKEDDPSKQLEAVGNNMNQMQSPYLDPSMLGNATVQAAQFGNEQAPVQVGQVVSEGPVGMTTLSEEQILGTDVDISKFQKDGVTKELEEKLDNLKKERNLHKQAVDFMMESEALREFAKE